MTIRRPQTFSTAAAIALAGALGTADPAQSSTPLAASRMIIEFNSSAEDIGVQVFLDHSDGWKEIEIFDPGGKEIFSAEAEGRLLKQGGGTELFLESVEPPLDELPLETFFRRFPEGKYKFRGVNADGEKLVGEAKFTHDVPAGTTILSPAPTGGAECAEKVAIPAVFSWTPVATSIGGAPLQIVKYELIVENDALNFDVIVPASAGTTVTLPPEILESSTDYLFEVLAIEKGGNQTITEGCFTTAN